MDVVEGIGKWKGHSNVRWIGNFMCWLLSEVNGCGWRFAGLEMVTLFQISRSFYWIENCLLSFVRAYLFSHFFVNNYDGNYIIPWSLSRVWKYVFLRTELSRWRILFTLLWFPWNYSAIHHFHECQIYTIQNYLSNFWFESLHLK